MSNSLRFARTFDVGAGYQLLVQRKLDGNQNICLFFSSTAFTGDRVDLKLEVGKAALPAEEYENKWQSVGILLEEFTQEKAEAVFLESILPTIEVIEMTST